MQILLNERFSSHYSSTFFNGFNCFGYRSWRIFFEISLQVFLVRLELTLWSVEFNSAKSLDSSIGIFVAVADESSFRLNPQCFADLFIGELLATHVHRQKFLLNTGMRMAKGHF